ncbi:MAG: M48 family metallopeptidase [Synoicihabitans sp.]
MSFLQAQSPFRLIALAAAVLLTSVGCQEVPVTGRNAVSLVDDKAITEKAIAEFEQIKSMQRLSRNPSQIRIVQQIGDRLSRTVFWDVPHAEWEFVVFQAPGVMNAFAMPGGKVGVFSGLIDFCENEDQLASVIAHEIAHVAARHTHEKYSQGMLLQPLGIATSVGVGASIGGMGVYVPSVGSTAGGGVTAITQSAFDRGKELEADRIGLIYMAKAGYDPRESLRLLERMEEDIASKGGPTTNGWLANHPGFPQRQIKINERLPEAMAIYEKGETIGSHTVIE